MIENVEYSFILMEISLSVDISPIKPLESTCFRLQLGP